MTQNEMQIWVIFSGETEIRWLRFCFRKGFRHCYLIMNDGVKWITYDPLAHKTEIAVHHHAPAQFDLPAWLENRGLKAVRVMPQDDILKPLSPAFFTCVEAVKRVIGLRKFHIQTPYQLYKHIR